MDELVLVIGEDGVARIHKEPYATIEVATEEDYIFLKDAIKLAREVKSAGQWISVNDHLPETIPVTGCNTAYSEAVVVLTSGRKILTAIYDGTDFICDASFWDAEGEEITHWKSVLPLPEQTEKERSNESQT